MVPSNSSTSQDEKHVQFSMKFSMSISPFCDVLFEYGLEYDIGYIHIILYGDFDYDFL